MNILRPTGFDSYLGQEQVKNNLKIIAASVRKGFDPLGHTLLCGPAGVGKTSLSRIFVKEATGMPIRTESVGPHITCPNDLDNFMMKHGLDESIFIDEIHALPKRVEEALYEAMEDFKWKDQKINPFTVIGATTREGLLTKPLLSRFSIIETLSLYSIDELVQIVHRSSEIMNVKVSSEAEQEIARRSRGTPRMANQLLKRVNYYAVNKVITLDITSKALDDIGIDSQGLDKIDRVILKAIAKNGPIGIDSLASIVNEDLTTVEILREPYLVAAELVQRTSSGRIVTEKAKSIYKEIL